MRHIVQNFHAHHKAVVCVFFLEVEYVLVDDFDLTIIKQRLVLLAQQVFAVLRQLWADFNKYDLAVPVDLEAIIAIEL